MIGGALAFSALAFVALGGAAVAKGVAVARAAFDPEAWQPSPGEPIEVFLWFGLGFACFGVASIVWGLAP